MVAKEQRDYANDKSFTLHLAGLFIALFTVTMLLPDQSKRRKLSINLGGGKCKWTGAAAIEDGAEVFGTLLAGYPASGMRVTWQQTSAITGIQVRDDFFNLHLPRVGIVKTQYPHYDGIWSYGSNLDQVILILRNPRWALPSFHTLIAETDYAYTWALGNEAQYKVFQKRPPLEDWTKWRDYRFHDEIRLWGLFIDFYMENGAKYWMDYDYERNGQYPFHLLDDTEKPWPRDVNCIYNIDCFPKAVISYENMIDEAKGPTELRKIANVLRGKPGMNVIEDEAIDCIWGETWKEAPEPSNANRDRNGLPSNAYTFTIEQMYAIENKLEDYIEKYGSGKWSSNPIAADLVTNFNSYLEDVSEEIFSMEENPQPTPAPYASYPDDIKDWYVGLNLGDRYNKTKMQERDIWDMVKHFYDDDDVVDSAYPNPFTDDEYIG